MKFATLALLLALNTLLISGCTTIHEATIQGDLNTVRNKLNDGTHIDSLDAQGQTPLIVAATYGQTDIAQLLVDRGADINKRKPSGDSALSAAIWMQRYDIAKLLLQQNVEIDGVNSRQNTPLLLLAGNDAANGGLALFLMYSAANSDTKKVTDVEIAKLLLEKGANPKAVNANGDSAIILAAASGKIGIINLLLENKVDVNTANLTGGTPLVFAAKQGHVEAVKLLLANKAKVNHVTGSANTPLTWAAAGGHTEIVKLLLAKGADVTIRNLEGKTAADLAKEKGKTEVYALLVPGHNTSTQVAATADQTTMVKAFIKKNDQQGLRNYLNAYPGALAAIENNEMRLRYTGPTELRILDIEQLSKKNSRSPLIVAQINSAGGPYKKFSANELSILKKMGLADEVVAAMISVTTEYNKEQKRLAKQPRVTQPAPVAQKTVEQATVQPQQTEASVPEECMKLVAAIKACDQTGGWMAAGCKMGAKASFNCPVPLETIMR